MPTSRKLLACEFIAAINDSLKRPRFPVDLTDESDWVSGAITTTKGAGNPAGSVVKISSEAESRLVGSFEQLLAALRDEPIAGQTTFDQVFWDALSQVERGANPHTDTTLFTFGRAQKFINISLKYCYVWWFCTGNNSPKYGDLSWVERWAPYFHIPVDNFTLKHFVGTKHEHVAKSGSMVISWKWHLSKSRYCRIQDAIRHFARLHGYEDPLHYEMEKIWPVGGSDEET